MIVVSQETEIVHFYKGYKMKKTVIAMVTAVGLSSTLMAMGPGMQGSQGSKGMHSCKHIKGKHHKKRDEIHKTLQQLDLTEAQKKELQALRETQRAERQANRKKMQERREARRAKRDQKPDLGRFMSAEKFDKEAFKVVMQERMEKRLRMKKERRERMMEKRAENMEKIFHILTPEQREKWIQLSKS